MKIIFAIIFSLACVPAHADARDELEEYVKDWTRDLGPKGKQRALDQIDNVLRSATAHGIDHLLLAVMISKESSWNFRAVGKRGEVGLLQVHTRFAKKGFDLTQSAQQIEAGATWLKKCITRCGTVRGGVNAYTTDSCTAPWRGLGHRMSAYRAAVKKYRGGKHARHA